MALCSVVVNQKGGVGKTTTAVNLAACAAEDGRNVLLVDMDPQGNATSGVGVDRSLLDYCVYDLLTDDEALADPKPALKRVIVPSAVPKLDLIPATIDLAGADLTLASAISRETRLRQILAPVRRKYDIIIIDTAPSLGLLTVNSLAAADGAIIPIQCEYLALEGLTQLLHTVDLVQRNLNPRLTVRGMLLTMYDARTNLSRQVVDEVRTHFDKLVFKTIIPRSVRLSEAPSHGETILSYAPESAGARAYQALTAELLRSEAR